MNTELKKEWNTYRKYIADGHVELFVGLGLLIFGGCTLFQFNQVFLWLVPAIILIPIQEWRERIVIPRKGQVEFSQPMIDRELLKFVVVNFIFIALFVALHYLLMFRQNDLTVWIPPQETNIVWEVCLLIDLWLIVIAITRKAPQHYLFAAINTLGWGMVSWKLIHPAYPFLMLSLALILYGGFKVRQFLNRYPKPMAVVEEPPHPAADAAFDRRIDTAKRISSTYLSTGVNDFSCALLFLIIGQEIWKPNWDYSSNITFTSCFAGCLIISNLWNSYVIRRKIKNENFRFAEEVSAANISPYQMFAFLPLLMFWYVPRYQPKFIPPVLDGSIDLLWVGCIVAFGLIVLGKSRSRSDLIQLIGTGALYLVLRFCKVSSADASIISGLTMFSFGVLKAIRFLRTPLQFDPIVEPVEEVAK